ncbi:MAG: hypothetical protein K2Z81_18370 [Cyanobacteria bacterium]|nr:hypothetical protein [Cyanobacteriota bacterium]
MLPIKLTTRQHLRPRTDGAGLVQKQKRRGLELSLVIACFLVTGAALAYGNSARNSLLKTRDQVADQRYQLEKAYSDVDRAIQQLQQKKFSIGRYLQDCDRSLRELDRAISAQDKAYNDIR